MNGFLVNAREVSGPSLLLPPFRRPTYYYTQWGRLRLLCLYNTRSQACLISAQLGQSQRVRGAS